MLFHYNCYIRLYNERDVFPVSLLFVVLFLYKFYCKIEIHVYYFLIYLSQFKSKDLLAEAAKHLTPEELGELLLAYQHNVLRADQVDAPANGLLSGADHLPRSSSTNREADSSKDSHPRLN